MTTDNRTNGQLSGISGQFTDEQVEAAAKAMHERDLAKSEELYPNRPSMWAKLRPAYYEHARAALAAAQGAAPRLIGRLDLARHYWRSQGYDYDLHGLDGNNDYEMGLAVADAALAALAAAQGAAPQAESECLCYGADGVTEPKCPACLAAECDRDRMGICKRCGMGWDARKVLDGDLACPLLSSSGVDEAALAEEIGRHKLVHVSVSRKSAFCVCNPSVTAGVDDNRAWFEWHRARAVAEWLKDGAK